jgi:hypothetical protein
VTEAGHKIDSPPRVVRVDLAAGRKQMYYEVPPGRWIETGAATGACWHDGYLYFMNTDALTRINAAGRAEDIVTGLPGHGDHQAPGAHDVPAHDLVLTGRNYEFRDVLGSLTDTARSGAFVPFGTETHHGQVIKGDVKCNGAVLRCNPDGSGLEVVAWGLRATRMAWRLRRMDACLPPSTARTTAADAT